MLVWLMLASQSTYADDQDALTTATDATAAQWSFQLAYQNMPRYPNDTLPDDATCPDGFDNDWQARVVAPLPFISTRQKSYARLRCDLMLIKSRGITCLPGLRVG